MIKTAILTVSDKGSKNEREDVTGPSIKNLIINDGYSVEYYKIIPDEINVIEQELIYLCDELKVNLILTAGGTGFSLRDVTPEATLNVIEKQVPGMAEVMRSASMKITPRAMLSRSVCGIRNFTLIINLPGSPKGAVQNLEAILPALPHGISILVGEANECAR